MARSPNATLTAVDYYVLGHGVRPLGVPVVRHDVLVEPVPPYGRVRRQNCPFCYAAAEKDEVEV